jgi:hypothetical protein
VHRCDDSCRPGWCDAISSALIGCALDSDLRAIANVPAITVFLRLSASIFAALPRRQATHVNRVVAWRLLAPGRVDDLDDLRALAASGENSAAIAVRLNRTAAGVRKRAMDLGVRLAGSKRKLGLKAKGK